MPLNFMCPVCRHFMCYRCWRDHEGTLTRITATSAVATRVLPRESNRAELSDLRAWYNKSMSRKNIVKFLGHNQRENNGRANIEPYLRAATDCGRSMFAVDLVAASNTATNCRSILRTYFCFVSVVFDFAFGGVSVFASRYPAFLASSSDMNLPRLVLP